MTLAKATEFKPDKTNTIHTAKLPGVCVCSLNGYILEIHKTDAVLVIMPLICSTFHETF